jgi:hypothetical protein
MSVLILMHNIDIMRQEHNMGESVISTCISLLGKTKGNTKALKDLTDLCNRPTVELTETGGKPCALLCLKPQQRKEAMNLGFKAQPRNPHFSSPHAWCRPHTMPPDLSIARPPSTRLVRPSPVLCTKSPTSAMILIAARHVMPATCTRRDKQRDSPHDKRIKVKLPKCLGFEFKHHQVNNSSQSNQEIDHLVSQSPP